MQSDFINHFCEIRSLSFLGVGSNAGDSGDQLLYRNDHKTSNPYPQTTPTKPHRARAAVRRRKVKVLLLVRARRIDITLPGINDSNSHGARPVHLIIAMTGQYIVNQEVPLSGGCRMPQRAEGFWLFRRLVASVASGNDARGDELPALSRTISPYRGTKPPFSDP